MKQYNICLAKVPQPPKDCTGEPVMLTDATVQERLNKVLQGMKERSLEQLVVYGDAEHCGNFQYLMGYFTRFEESLLVLDADADHAITRCAAQTETKESLLAAMEADSTLSPALKQAVIENVLKGRFFD